jgi:DNA repair photolyase
MLLQAGFGLNILTKSRLVLRDLDLFAGRDVQLGVTITTPDQAHARVWEPRASPVSARLEVLRQAKSAGLRTAIMFGPLLPGISDSQDVLDELFALAAELDVDHIWTDAINPRPRVWPSVQALLRRRRPDLLDLYRDVLFKRARREQYLRALHARIARAADAAGVTGRLA